MRAIPDPYRVLGVAREATSGEIKAAHRRLAKRYHPDAAEGDTERFLAVQEAYQVLSDPLARRDWDARHRPGPVRADGGGGGRARPARSGAGRGAPRGRTADRTPAGPEAAASGSGPDTERAAAKPGTGPTRRQRRRPDAFSTSGRDPTADGYTWSAQDVPWWTSRGARGRAAGAPDPAAGAPDPAGAADRAADAPTAGTAPGPPSTADFDVYDRSSGAAWSMASRAYFRRAGADLPRGAAEPFGQRWTTPQGRPSTGPGRTRSARPASPSPPPASPPARPTRAAPTPPETAPPPRAASAEPVLARPADTFAGPAPSGPAFAGPSASGVVFGSRAAAGLRGRLEGAGAWPTVGARVLYTSIGWLVLVVGSVFGPVEIPAPLLAGLLAGLLVALALAPRLAYLAAVGGVAAVVIGAGVLLAGVVAGPHASAAYQTAGPIATVVGYLVAAGLAALGWPVPRPWR